MTNISFDDLFNAIVSRESSGNPNAVSPQGAKGTAQIMPNTFKQYAKAGESFNNDEDRRTVAKRYLQHLGEITNWDAHKMAQGYIAGPGGIGKNRTDSLGTKTQDYASQVLARVGKGKTVPTVAVEDEEDLDFDSLMPKKEEEDIDFQSLMPSIDTTDNRTFGRRLYDVSELGTGAIGGIAGGTIGMGAGPLGAVAGGALGTAGALSARRALGTMLGYETPLEPTDLAVQTGEDLATGAISEAGGQIATKVLGAIIKPIMNPGDSVRSLLGGSQTSQTALLAAKDTAATNIPLSAAQRSGKTAALGIERVLESVPGSKGIYAAFKEKQLQDSVDALDNVAASLGQVRQPQGLVGIRVLHTFDRVVDEAVKARSTQGATDFAFLDTSMGNTRYIPLQNFKDAVQKEVDRISTIGAHPADNARRTQLTRILQDIEKNNSKATGKDLNGLLSGYSKAMHGGGSIFDNIAPDSADRALAGRLFNSIDQDLANAATTPGMQSNIANGLATARNNWRMHSDALSQMQDSIIGKTLGIDVRPSGEAIYKKVTSMAPSDIRHTTRILDGADPTVMQDVRARYLEDIIENASTVIRAPGTGSRPNMELSSGAFIKSMNKERNKLNALMPSAAPQIESITKQLARIHATEQPIGYLSGATKVTGGGIVMSQAIYGNIPTTIAAAGVVGVAYLGNKTIAKALTNQQGINAMRKLVSPNATRSQVVNAWNAVLNAAQVEDKEESISTIPQTPLLPSNYMNADNSR